MTLNDPKERSLGQTCILVIKSAQYKNILSTLRHALSEKRHMNIFPLPYNGEVSELTLSQVTESKFRVMLFVCTDARIKS